MPRATLIVAAGNVARAALLSAFAVTLAVALVSPARAHLVPSGSDTLLGMMAAADGMVVARSAAATHARDTHFAATPFLSREVVAGAGPDGAFVLDAEAPILRYAELQDVLVLVARRPAAGATRWLSVQPAGAAIVLAGPTLPEGSRELLKRLWSVAHPPMGSTPDPALAVGALIDALVLPEQKLRALAYLDLARLASDPEHFSPAAIARLVRYGKGPADDPQLAIAVNDLGRRLQGDPAAAGATPAKKGQSR